MSFMIDNLSNLSEIGLLVKDTNKIDIIIIGKALKFR